MSVDIQQFISPCRLAAYQLPGESLQAGLARTRQQISVRLHQIKALRNRIAHHEPIWKQTPAVCEVHQTCVEIISAMSADAATELAGIDRFDNIYNAGPGSVPERGQLVDSH